MATKRTTPPEPWERQPRESEGEFAAFIIYRDADPKISAEKVGGKVGKSSTYTERLCTKWRWKERREQWADEQDRLARDTLTKGVTTMRKNHTDIATAMLVKALKALQKLPIEEMSPRDIATMVDVAAKLERISRGEATEKTESKNATEHSGEVLVRHDPYEELSVEELRGLLDIEKGQLHAPD